jgi:tetratricopeptide (TPR) repeat protein
VRARYLLATGKRSHAQIARDDLARIERGPASVAYWRGKAEHALGNLDAADDAFSAALGRDPKLAVAWLSRGSLRTERRNDDGRALSDLDEAVRLAPRSFDAHNARAGLLLAKANPRDAIPDLERMLELARTDEERANAKNLLSSFGAK